MAHLTLYRKWRPQRFDDVIGQAHVVRTLTNALAQGRTAHAYLFAGPRGTGKTTLARLLAKGLNCQQGPTPTPCNRCPSCAQITEGSALDVMEIDGASNRGIDEVRELRDRIRYAPAQSRYKVYIIDEVHMLTNEAFNALLKMLEEPPAHVVFIFATTEPQRLPATILSRCQRFDFRRLSFEELTAHLAAVARSEGLNADGTALELIARHADGGVRDALSMLEQCMAYEPKALDARTVAEVLGLVRPEALSELALCFVEGKVGEGLELLQRLTAEEGVDSRLVAKDLLGLLRDAATYKMLGGRSPAGGPSAGGVEELARRAPMTRLVAAMEALVTAEPQMRWAPDPRLLLELALMRLASEIELEKTAPVAPKTVASSAASSRATGAPPEPPGSQPASAEPGPPADPGPELSPPAAAVPAPAAGAPAQHPAAPAAERTRRTATPARGGARKALPLTLEEVVRHWGDVLSALRSLQHLDAAKAGAFLREARPVRLDGLEVVVGFPRPKAFLASSLQENARVRNQAERVLSRLFGRPITVRAEVIDGDAAAQGAEQLPEDQPALGEHQTASSEMAAAVEPAPSAGPAVMAGPAVEAAPPPAAAPRKTRSRSASAPAPSSNGARLGPQEPEDEFDKTVLDAVLQMLDARIIKEFDESDLTGAQPDDTPEAGAAEGSRDSAG
ncbi:MAG: DNA polymerase III subunit gamma/tau [Bacillota bacterium]